MKTLIVKRIDSIPEVENISSIFTKKELEYEIVDLVNWNAFPYKPIVNFRIAHDGHNIYMNWMVNEDDVQAVCEYDSGEIWKDSCVEFFVSFDEKNYYNIETNCIGKVLVGIGSSRQGRTRASTGLMNGIKRWSSMGDKAIRGAKGKWELSLIIPVKLFYLNDLPSLNGIKARANFYKCGDDLPVPHFLSWNKIESETPNFHLPNYFGNLIFDENLV